MLSFADGRLWLECCGKRSIGGYSRLMSDYSNFDRIVPVSKLRVAFSVLLLLCAFSGSVSEASISNCSKISHWIYDEIEFSEIESFMEVTVTPTNYIFFGRKIANDEALAEALKKQIAEGKKWSLNPRYIFLRSSQDVSCDRFSHAAAVIDANYPCGRGNLCIWAYGLGSGAMPLGIDPPPGAAHSEQN